MSSYEDIRILTHIIGSVGQTMLSVGDRNCLNRTSLTPALTALLSLSWYWR
ncbi:hypothetical protein [Nostoc sp.]|uniref:hypothetical protein n=1 Tax=Nostoc sp. TaxID=1180 RepID=UPI002FF804FE